MIGLDLSLRSSSGVILHHDWDPLRPRERATFDAWGYALKDDAAPDELMKRVESIAVGINELVDKAYVLADLGRASARLADGLQIHESAALGNVFVFVEDYAYGRAAKGGTRLAELGGAVKLMVFRRSGIVVQPIVQSRAQKYLLGKLPSGKGTRSPAVQAAVRSLGFEFDRSDPADAFTIANAGRAELGLPGVTLAG